MLGGLGAPHLKGFNSTSKFGEMINCSHRRLQISFQQLVFFIFLSKSVSLSERSSQYVS